MISLLFFYLCSSPAAHAQAGKPLPEKKWVAFIAQSDSTPAIAPDGTIYLGSTDQKFFAISSNGVVKWTFKTGSEIYSSPAIAPDGTIYFGCRDQYLYALTDQGKEKWKFKANGWIDSSPGLGSDGTICFGSWDKNFYALNPDGTLKWKFPTGGGIDSSPAIDTDETLYFGSHDKKLYALSPNGKKRWEFQTGGVIISSPALTGTGLIYFTSLDGFLYAVDSEGTLHWRLHTGGITESSPTIGENGTIYLGVNKTLWAISPEGKKLRESGLNYEVRATPAVAAGNLVSIISHYGDLRLLNAGHDSDFFYLYIYGHASSTISPEGTVYLPGEYQRLYALDYGRRPANSPWWKFRANARNTGHVNNSENP